MSMVLLPIFSIGNEHYILHSPAPLMLLVGKWFVFWSAGVRIFGAGLRQFFQPRFTVEEIFGIRNEGALPFVRELGIANFATGTVGVLSIVQSSFILPVAIIATLFFGIAGIRHVTDKHKNLKQYMTTATDLFVSLALIGYIAYAVIL
ncbi:MAG: DUF6790 family protein [Terracidiphilus sp.]